MSQDVVINGTTYPAVESVALMDANGNTTMFYPDAVRYVAQNLTAAQKAQARANIEAVSKTGLSLGYHTDGLIYIFADGVPVGTGVELPTGGIDGYVDSDKNIVVRGLSDGSYKFFFEMEDGSLVPGGDLVLDTNVYYSVVNNLTQCTNNNSLTRVIGGESYSATITAKSGYELKSVVVTMGGAAVSVSGGVINIASVTGNIVITAVAEETVAAEPTNFAEPNATNKTDWSIWCNDARFGSDGLYRSNSGTVVTNYIPIKVGDTLYFEGISVNTTSTAMTNGLAFYDSSKASICPSHLSWYVNNGPYLAVDVTDGAYTIDILDKFGDYKASGKPAGSQTAYVRIAGALTGSLDDVVIRVKRNGVWL